MSRRLVASLAVMMAVAVALHAQEPGSSGQPLSVPAPPERSARLVYANRPIVELRAQVLSRMPAERAAAAVRTLDELVARGVTSPVTTRELAGAVFLLVGGAAVIAIVPEDVDALAGETPASYAAAAVPRLQTALGEAAELRAPQRLLRAIAETAAITALLIAVLWLLQRTYWFSRLRLAHVVGTTRSRKWGVAALSATHLPIVLQKVVALALGSVALVLGYLWFAFVLRRFPYTRPWGESLRSLLFGQLATLGSSVLQALPGLFTVALIAIAAWWLSKGVRTLFDAVAAGRVSLPGVYVDTAVPTRRLVVALVWLAALAVAYPYVPGSDSDGFKGISVFVGLVISLGSTGVVQHLMSGLMLTFSRAVHAGDFARIGEVEGTVVQISALATKVRTLSGEEVTIPNALVVSQNIVNYSADAAGTRVSTSVTIGYDTPWRQVEALLLAAARETPGLLATPPPVVRCVSLDDYYVKYTLLASADHQAPHFELRARLHERILDAFNAHGVQIMSPHYVADPAAPKIVPPSRWHADPASPSTGDAEAAPVRSRRPSARHNMR
jgi:small-conductance mechanosensitive channel